MERMRQLPPICELLPSYAQTPQHTFPLNFLVDGEVANKSL